MAKSDTHMLTLCKADFDSIFAAAVEADNERLRYFDRLLSDELSKPAIVEFHYHFTEEVYERGNFLFRQGEPVNNLYFVKSGGIELYKRPQENGKFVDRAMFKSHQDVSNKSLGKNGRVINVKARPEFIGIVGVGQMFGDEDMLEGNPLYSYTAKAMHSSTSVYVIEKQKFQNSCVI
jgi:CRP-like cAMP-binding protein